jgi:hypothetical protein
MLMQGIIEYGYALGDIITELSNLVCKIQFPDSVTALLLDRMSTIEYRLSHGVSEQLQLGSLVGGFTIAKTKMMA